MTALQTFAIQILSLFFISISEYYAIVFLGLAQAIGYFIGMILVRSLGKRRIVFMSIIGCGVYFGAVATDNYMSNMSVSSSKQEKQFNSLSECINQ